MKGVVGTVVTMGVIYWIAYGLAVAIALALVGFLLIMIAGVVGFIYYVSTIRGCIARNDAEGAWVLLMAPALLTGVSLIATMIWMAGGPAFSTAVVGHFAEGKESLGDDLVIFPLGLIALFGWIIPLIYAHEWATDLSFRSKRPTAEFVDKLFGNPTAIAVTSIIWGVVGGSSFAIGAMLPPTA